MATVAPPRPADLAADKARALALTPVSRETEERLDALVALALQWQARINLVGPATLPQFWTRHIADSLQLLTHAPAAQRWLDLGSGGGFPGLALAAAFVTERPGATVDLVERNAKKAAFLREAARALGLPARVHVQDIGDYVHNLAPGPDVVTARAVAPLSLLLDWTAPLLAAGVQALFLKGQDVEAELTEAAKYWKMDYRLLPSVTAAASRLVALSSATPRTR